MSSFSQENIKGSPITYFYIALGGLGSLLMLFLVRQSLPLNQQQVQEYHQDIQRAKQEIFELEKNLFQSGYANQEFAPDLDSQLSDTEAALNRLQNIPDFFGRAEQNVIESQLEVQEILLTSQSKLIERFENAVATLSKSCAYIPKLNAEIRKNPAIIGSDLSSDSQLVALVSNLLEDTGRYCYEVDTQLEAKIESQIRQVNLLLKQKEFIKYQFIVSEFIKNGENIILQKQEIKNLIQQIELDSLNHRLVELESEYFEQYVKSLKKISIYRLFAALLLLLTVILVAYIIINNLAKTNRSIVKVLEGFTQELETKVEQRTSQLEESIQNTEAALTQAQNASKAKSRFLANMSHELRTPLNAILGFTQLMCRDASLSNEQKENIQIINRSGEHLLKLINDILEMSKIEVGQINLNEAKFDLSTMLKSIEEMLRLKAVAKNLSLTFNIAPNVPKYIYTDEGKLRQIAINLLGNALKFTEQGAITLTVELRENTTAAEDNIDFLFSDTYALHFAVQDTGPGIEKEEMEKLFSPFEQTKVGRISNEGTGLGLSICQKFVELMGGKLKVESVVGKGSTFSFEILIKLQDTEVSQVFNDSELEETRRIISLAPNQPEYKILAVDDVPASRLLLRKILTNVGFTVKEAGDGQQALDLWSSWHPDLILMDMRMPVMDGYEATKQIKSQPQGKKTIVIALTASAFEEERVVILSAGCDDFMRKPFYETELLEKISQYLNVDYLYEETVDVVADPPASSEELTKESLAVMSLKWRSQLYEAAAKVDNQEIMQLLEEIPQEYESLARGLENLVEHFRCDKIIDLTESVN